MKVCVPVEKLHAKIGLLLLGVFICSCNTLKRVESDELLLTDFEISADGNSVTDPGAKALVLQKPNKKVLGVPLKLHLYNLAKKDADSSFQAWLMRKDKREQRLIRLLSKKQLDRLGESFLVSGYSRWLKRIGEPPAVIDSSRAERTLERLRGYYNNRGYFNNTTSLEIDSTGKQKAIMRYLVELGQPYLIDSLDSNIASPAVDSLYQLHKEASNVRPGEQFDLRNFTAERERLTDLFRNSGIWNFQESSINFGIVRDTLNRDDQQMEVALNIENLRRRGDSAITTEPYRVRRMGEINLFPDYTLDQNTDSLRSIKDGDFTIYYSGKLRYKPRALTNTIFLDKDSIYRDIDRLRTYRQITNLNTFRYPNIELIEAPNNRLDANIYLAARPRNSLALDFDLSHSNIQQVGVGLGVSLLTRNIFGGAETLSLSARGTFGLLGEGIPDERYFSEVGGDINLVFPRIWGLPFLNKKSVIPYYMLPRTRVSLGTNFQKNIGLDKQTLNNIYQYSWNPSDSKSIQMEALDIQFVRNVNPDRFYNVYRSTYGRLDDIAEDFQDVPELADFYEPTGDPGRPLRLSIPDGTEGFTNAVLVDELVPVDSPTYREVFNIEERRIRLTENNLIVGTSFTHTKNTKTGINDNSFYQFRWKLGGAGNLLNLFSQIIPFNENEDGQKLVFNVPYSQYVKGEVDYIRHWALSESNTLAFRTFLGLAVPYGNSGDIPFVRSYFAGGSNDNRAWFPYSLGPGSTQNLNDFNEANFKIALNLEYRFPVVGDLKGALFADVGNIWNLWDSEDDPAATFEGLGSLVDIGLGTGFGLRYDFTYFVLRADLGFKTYNPAEPQSQRWFREYNFANSVLQIGINYPF